MLTGMAVLLVGLVVARPYCRYFCPYGVLLEICARLSWRSVSLTENTCINCRLCAGTCPVDAIVAPRAPLNDAARLRQFKRFMTLLALAPLLVAGCAGAGWLAGAAVAKAHPDVALVEHLDRATPETEDLFPEIEAFKRTGKSRAAADAQAAQTVARFRSGCAGAGLFMGLVIALRLLGLTRLQRRALHEADRIRCVACGRCFAACPKNQTREVPCGPPPAEPDTLTSRTTG
jgi:NAD-dependent dihydropyrimidine dehydrogenase PreA subunit